jgi:hypothetical protein
MLFSLTKKFLFIANLKTASTAIEKMLAPHADLRLLRSEFGKHLTFARFVKHFEYLAGRIDMNEVFVFGVMREPVDYVGSMYNSHSKERFRGIPNLYTGEMSFEQFLSRWAPDHPDQLRPQISRFTRANGDVAANFLISYDKLQEGLEVVAERIKVPALTKLPRENESPRRVSRADLSADQIGWIEERLHKDVDAIRRHCNQLRFPERAPA